MKSATISRLILPIIVPAVVFLAGCRQQKEMKVLAEKIQYDVPVKHADQDIAWWINNLEGSKRDPFLETLFEKVNSGEMQAYDYFNEPLSLEEVRRIGSDTIYQTLVREYPPYTEYDTMVITTISYRDVTKIRFLERWVYDEKSMEIRKTVIGLAPVMVREYGSETYNQVLFWVYPGEPPVED